MAEKETRRRNDSLDQEAGGQHAGDGHTESEQDGTADLESELEWRDRAIAELTEKRNRLRDQLAETNGATTGVNTELDLTANDRFASGRDLFTLEELMAETVVLTDEDRDSVGLEPADTGASGSRSGAHAEMVAPELILRPSSGNDATQQDSGGEYRSDDETAADGRRGTLVVTLQGEHQFRYPVYDSEITIGRAKQNDIQINSEFISRVHARITMSDGDAVIEDVSSKNGILIDSAPVNSHTFKYGDVVMLGTTRIAYLAANDSQT